MAVDATTSGWERWHAWNACVMRPVTDWFCRAIEAAPGMTVLDAACGTGLPSLAMAERVAPGGKVVALDVSQEMIAGARRIAAAAGLSNVEHRVMDMAALRFDDASFDAATCSFGLMFCQDPVAAARGLRRALIPGGRIAVSVWDEPAGNPFFTIVFDALERLLPRSPSAPSVPGPFRLASRGELTRVLRQAGFADIEVETCQVSFDFDSLDVHWQVVADMATPVRAALAVLHAAGRERLKQDIAAAAGQYAVEGSVRIPGSALCARGRA